MSFHETIRDMLNAAADKAGEYPMRWTESSFHHDACGSVMLDIHEASETYVQMFAFETAEEAAAEDLKQYSITTFINGQPNYTAWEGHDGLEAMEVAHEYAKAIWNSLASEWAAVEKGDAQ